MDQNKLRQLASKDDVKNELVKQFTKHIEEEELEDFDETVVKVKLVVVGPANAGKTSWASQLTQGKFNQAQQPTIGAKFSSQGVAIEDMVYNFEIWDVSGDEWYKSLVPMYLQYAQAVVVCYDVTSRSSFEESKDWISYVRDIGEKDLLVSYVGMKSDLVEVSGTDITALTDEAYKFFVEEKGVNADFFFPAVSAKTGDKVQDVILNIAEVMHEQGIKSPRASVLDPSTAYKFASRAQNNNTLMKDGKTTPPFYTKFISEETMASLRQKMTACSAQTKVWFGACFETSKEQAKKTYNSTKKNVREISATVDRKSRKLGNNLKKRTAQLINKPMMEEVDTNYDSVVYVGGEESGEGDGDEPNVKKTNKQGPMIQKLKG